MQQLPKFIHEKSNDNNNTVRDNGTLRRRISRRRLNEADGKEEADIKINGNVSCKDTTSSTEDGCYCKDTDGIDLRQGSSHSTVTCSNFGAYDTRRPQSWITIYPSEARARLNDGDVFVPRAINVRTNVERRDCRRNNDRDNVCGDDSEYTVCHAIDDNGRLPKSIYTECAAYGEDSKERFADSCKYRNKILRESVINDTWKRQVGYKFLQQSLGSCPREPVARKWSTCSCIAEEEEDYCKGIDRIEKELPENVCNIVECPEKISVCRTPSEKLAESAAVETSCNAPGKYFEETRTCEDSAECLIDTSTCGRRLGNSEESSKVTRVCKEFVTEEASKDITVCKTVFGESNGLEEEVIVYRSALSDSKDTPKETICIEFPESKFANQDDVNRLSLNDKKNKLVEENRNSSNLNNPKGNTENRRTVKLNNELDNDALNHFTRQQSDNIGRQRRKTLKDQSKNLHQIPIESIKNFKPSSKNASTTLHVQFYNHSIPVSNPNAKKASKTLVNQQRMQTLNRLRNYSQRPDNLTQNLAPNKNNQQKKKTQENSKEEEEGQDILKKVETTEDKRKSLLRRSFKKAADVIKRSRAFVIDRIETGQIEVKKTIADGKKDDEKSKIISEIKKKVDDVEDQQKITKKVAVPMRSPQTEIANEGKLITS